MAEEKYTREDLKTIPIGTHTFTLNMTFFSFYERSMKELVYEGEVTVKRVDDRFTFLFTTQGIPYKFDSGLFDIHIDSMLHFPPGPDSTWFTAIVKLS